MLDFGTRFGKRVSRRLRREQVVWLTTVGPKGDPLPRPVWFQWDGKSLLIFSEKERAKLRHIARNPRVALNFNSDEEGGDVAVLLGEARILKSPPSPVRMRAYLRKYRQGLQDLDTTPEAFKKTYSAAVLVTPKSMRGFL